MSEFASFVKVIEGFGGSVFDRAGKQTRETNQL